MKRLQKQLKQVNQTMKQKGIIATSKQSLFHWQVLINGPATSPFQTFIIILDINFPQQFPFKFPHFKFKTPIYHPNIKDGQICKQMIGQKQWLPNKKVVQVLDIILSMLVSPDIGSAINLQAAQDYKNGVYSQKVKELMCKK